MSDSKVVYLNVEDSAEEDSDVFVTSDDNLLPVFLYDSGEEGDDENDDIQEDEGNLDSSGIGEMVDVEGEDMDVEGEDVDVEGEDVDVEGEDSDVEGATGCELEVDKANRIFKAHTDIVYSVKLDPVSSKTAVTGGKDDVAYVWDIKSGEILHKTCGHTDTVTCVGYSFDGRYLAIGDMSGYIEVIATSDLKMVWTYKTNDIEWMEWHHSAHILMTGNADGTVIVRIVPGEQCKVLPAGAVPITTGLFLPDGLRACSGDINGIVKVWDIKTSTCVHTIPGEGEIIVCMDSHPDNVLLMTGSTDCVARLLNSQSGKIIKALECSVIPRVFDDVVEVVGFSPTFPLVATGTLFGVLSIWDIRSCVRRELCLHPKGLVKLVWDKDRPMFYTACLDGILRLWDARVSEVVSSWTGHSDGIMDFDISRDGSMIVTTSRDHTARVFSTHHPQP